MSHKIGGRTRLLFVFGDPIGHSLSPFMHNRALETLGADLAYLPLHVPPQRIRTAVDLLRMPNVLGANVTLPHKESIIGLVDDLSPESKLIGAANTIHNRKGRLWATTTDPDGVLSSMREENYEPNGRRVVILGSGGSARTVAFAFAMKAGPAHLHLAARAPAKLEPLAAELNQKLGIVCGVSGTSAPDLQNAIKNTELLVNCTSAGMTPNTEALPIDPDLLHRGLTVYDLVYNPLETLLLRHAKARGCRAISGIGMLLHQGRLSLEIWLDQKIPAALFPREAVVAEMNRR